MAKTITRQKQSLPLDCSPLSRRDALAIGLTAGAAATASTGYAFAADVGALQAHIKRHKNLKRQKRQKDHAEKSWIESVVPGFQSQTTKAVPSSQRPLLDAITTVLRQGDACRRYCETALKNTTDTNLSTCLTATQQMLPVCSALAKLTELDARRLKSVAQVSIPFLTDCEAACLKTGDAHAAFRDCAVACNTAVRECQNFLRT